MTTRKIRSRAGRKPLPLGERGSVSVKRQPNGHFRASCRFRLASGETKTVSRQAKKRGDAERKLDAALRSLSANPGLITAETSLADLADLWIAELETSRFSATTKAQYTYAALNYVATRRAGVRVGEVHVPVVNGLLNELDSTPANARVARVVLGHMLNMAVDHGAIVASPVKHSRQVETTASEPDPPAVETLQIVADAVLAWEASWTSGPHRNTGLVLDTLDLLLATGLRIGEVLALRWQDLSLDDFAPSLVVAGTLVEPKGKGLYRQPKPKSKSGIRRVFIPPYAVELLNARRAREPKNDLDAVFASRVGTWESPGGFATMLKRIFAPYPELRRVTPKSFRSMVAQELHDNAEGGLETARLQLGHKSSSTTSRHYVNVAVDAPDESALLERKGSVSARLRRES